MPCLVRHLPLDPRDKRKAGPDLQAANLADAAQFEHPGGAYAVFSTWNGRRVVCLSKHLDRLEDSARRLGFETRLDREWLRQSLRTMIADHFAGEVRVRISLTPGSRYCTVSMEPYDGPPRQLQRTGVVCTTAPNAARKNPLAKSTTWIQERARLQKESREIPYENLLVDASGRILEGGSSNFAAIMPGPELRTAGEGVLTGIARSIVLEIAPPLPVVFTPPVVEEIPGMLEAFLSSSSRGIIPIVRIDGTEIGSGRPGLITAELIARYDKRARELEEAL